MGGGAGALRVRNPEVARQRQGRHVLLQGFLTSAQNMMLLFMQVNLSPLDLDLCEAVEIPDPSPGSSGTSLSECVCVGSCSEPSHI